MRLASDSAVPHGKLTPAVYWLGPPTGAGAGCGAGVGVPPTGADGGAQHVHEHGGQDWPLSHAGHAQPHPVEPEPEPELIC